jgi:hypothetical protein
VVNGDTPVWAALSVGGALDDEGVRSAGEPVDGGLGEQRVAHHGQPLNWFPVRGDDGAGPAVPAVLARSIAERDSRRVISSARTSSRNAAWLILRCRARASRSGRVWLIWPSLSAFNVRIR